MSMKPIKEQINDNEGKYAKLPARSSTKYAKLVSADEADRIAGWVEEKLGSPDSHAYYCTVAYRLPEAIIGRLVATAIEKGENPGALFHYLAEKEIKAGGIDE